jgi:hypothetical protein
LYPPAAPSQPTRIFSVAARCPVARPAVLLHDSEATPENPDFYFIYYILKKRLKEILIYNIRPGKMNKFDALSSYMAEMVDIMQEMQQKMQRVKEIKAEMDKLKQTETKTKAKKVTTTTNNNKITCECGCKINKSSWYTHIKTKKHEKLLNQPPKPEEKQEENHDDEEETHHHDHDRREDNDRGHDLNKAQSKTHSGNLGTTFMADLDLLEGFLSSPHRNNAKNKKQGTDQRDNRQYIYWRFLK